jgi:hypothetical protein
MKIRALTDHKSPATSNRNDAKPDMAAALHRRMNLVSVTCHLSSGSIILEMEYTPAKYPNPLMVRRIARSVQGTSNLAEK